MKISIAQYSGIRPRVDDRMLPDGNAQIAKNVNVERGGVRSIEGLREVFDPKMKNIQSIYRFGQGIRSETQHWFRWNKDVDVVKGPIADDVNERTYWTGDDAPKYTTTLLGTKGDELPYMWRELGITPPAQPPELVAIDAPTEPEPPTQLDDETDPDGEHEDKELAVTTETRVYVYTFVTEFGEESAPSPAQLVDIKIGQGVRLQNMLTVSDNNAVLEYKRIYRSQEGLYLFVAEIPVADEEYDDFIATDQLGEVCPRLEWDPPPADLSSLTIGHNGIMAGISGYSVRFCEPYYPHTYPIAYAQTLHYPCVGMSHFAQSFVVLTTGIPFIIEGSHPSQMVITPAQFYQPCLSKRSIVSTASDVLWASPDGLVGIGSSGTNNYTEGLFTPADWRKLRPETMIGAFHEGWYVGSYETDTGRESFMFKPATQEWITLPNMPITAFFRDTVGDALYVCVGDRIHKFRDGDLLEFEWKSREFNSALLDFNSARVTGTYPVTFRLFRDYKQIYEKEVLEDEPFKLPAGIGRMWEVSVSGVGEVLMISLGTAEVEL